MVYHALDSVGEGGYGTRVVITGAGGGVGSHAIQVAKAIGAEVIAATSSKWKDIIKSQRIFKEIFAFPE